MVLLKREGLPDAYLAAMVFHDHAAEYASLSRESDEQAGLNVMN